MVGIFFVQLLVNAFIFTFIFWGLTFLAKYTYSNKFYNYKLNFYECGFKNISGKRVVYELNFILIILFLLIYDGEFLVLVPFSLNASLLSYEVVVVMTFFFIWLCITLVFDYAHHGLEWQV